LLKPYHAYPLDKYVYALSKKFETKVKYKFLIYHKNVN
jgi:hypothetical protein